MTKKTSSRHAAKNRTPKTSHLAKSSSAGDVRIIGGEHKRRIVRFVDAEGLRPTPDRLRETLFNWLLADIHGAYVLDSCAGSGVLGFEALSRGAAHTTFIEPNPAQCRLLEQSATQLRLETHRYQIIQGTAEHVLTHTQTLQRHFDIVFIDPPYAQDLWQPILTTLIEQSLITSDTLLYLEADKALEDQLQQLADHLSQSTTGAAQTEPTSISFDCLKQTKVGQVVAGLYQLAPS